MSWGQNLEWLVMANQGRFQVPAGVTTPWPQALSVSNTRPLSGRSLPPLLWGEIYGCSVWLPRSCIRLDGDGKVHRSSTDWTSWTLS